ncbi:MAG: hypothetical protein IKH88_12930 [Prevotella sp.]|nr:hypothetical protein [Prevotella sp.]
MSIEINGNRLTFNNVDPFLILVLLGDKVVDKSVVNDIATPDFSVVVRPSGRPNCATKEGDYTVVVRKDSGEEIALDMPHRGAKVLYILTLLCQKVVGGLPNKYFKNDRAAAAIVALYDKLYRSGGAQWVENCKVKEHNISIYRSHAKNAVENNETLDNVVRYWCGFEEENEKRSVGKNQLQLRRTRIPNNRIVFEDAAKSSFTFEQLMEQLPPLEDLFGFKNKTTERIRELRSKKAKGVFPHS